MKHVLLVVMAGVAAGQDALTPREKMLLERIEKLEQRLASLESRLAAPARPAEVAPVAAAEPTPVAPAGATMNVVLDSYYGYNFNRPFTRTNALRGYDVSSNGFAVNQAVLVVERAPDVGGGRRFGGRFDVMFGQATETLQGSPANENRPEVFRHLFQAYGTYVAPVGKGLTVDFGKWASTIGMEGNYTKDQFNYSRAYWFSFLPFYHMGLRASYPVTGKLNATYWLTNGANQTEDFNGFKSHAVLLNYNVAPGVSANFNYFNGQEQRAVSGIAPRGRTHYLDTTVTWQAGERVTLAGEADYAIERVDPGAPPRVVTGGAGYARYRFTPRFSLASRFAYLSDANGLFTGTSQTIKDATATATFDVADGFQMRWEVRRDWSDAAFFPARFEGQRKRHQTSALVGLIWWFGGKQGAW